MKGVTTHYDPYWNGKNAKCKRTETPRSYVEVVYTDSYVKYQRNILSNLIMFFNSKEAKAMQSIKKTALLSEIKRLQSELNKYENTK